MSAAKRAVVLDFDGVLADSMPQHAQAYRQTLEPLGVQVLDEEIFRREGARSETIIMDLLSSAGVESSVESVSRLAQHKQDLFRRMGRPALYPGTERMLLSIAANAVLLGLVTGTRRENVDAILGDHVRHFRAILAQDAYKHDKPHPEPYANAAAAVGVPPAQCLAVENAVRGVASARAAGYAFVVGLTTTMKTTHLASAGADQVVDTHEQVAQSIDHWLRENR